MGSIRKPVTVLLAGLALLGIVKLVDGHYKTAYLHPSEWYKTIGVPEGGRVQFIEERPFKAELLCYARRMDSPSTQVSYERDYPRDETGNFICDPCGDNVQQEVTRQVFINNLVEDRDESITYTDGGCDGPLDDKVDAIKRETYIDHHGWRETCETVKGKRLLRKTDYNNNKEAFDNADNYLAQVKERFMKILAPEINQKMGEGAYPAWQYE